MLFDFRLSEDEIATIEPDSFFRGISEILRSHRLGHHLFVIDRKLGEWLASSLPLNDSEKAILRRIISEYAQFGNLKNHADIYACIKGNDSEIYGDGNVLYFPFSILNKPYFLDRVALITENSSNDGRLIRAIIENVARRRGLGKVNFELINGGGTTVEAVAANLIDDGRLITIVLDSDYHMPKDEPPATVRRLVALSTDRNWPFVFSSALPCRELENVISVDIVAKLACSVEKKDVFDAIRKIAANENKLKPDIRKGDFWRFFDTKKGLDKKKIDSLSEIEQKWLVSRLELAGCDGIGAISERIIQTLLADGQAMMSLASEVVKPEWWQEFGECLGPSLWIGVAAQRVRT